MHIDFIEIQGVEMLTYLPTSEGLIWVKLQPMASESYEFAANRKQKKIHSSFQIKKLFGCVNMGKRWANYSAHSS